MLMGLCQGHGPGKFFGRNVNFLHFDRIFLYILYMFGPGKPGFFLVSVSFGTGTFNGQDTPLSVCERKS
ncbi:hypothetical protein Hanom_Chr16g01471391 [Helianthus anomalus]